MRLHLLHCNSREKQTGLKLYVNICSFVPDLSLMFSKGMEEKVCVCRGWGARGVEAPLHPQLQLSLSCLWNAPSGMFFV